MTPIWSPKSPARHEHVRVAAPVMKLRRGWQVGEKDSQDPPRSEDFTVFI